MGLDLGLEIFHFGFGLKLQKKIVLVQFNNIIYSELNGGDQSDNIDLAQGNRNNMVKTEQSVGSLHFRSGVTGNKPMKKAYSNKVVQGKYNGKKGKVGFILPAYYEFGNQIINIKIYDNNMQWKFYQI
jgi:hypothetical protein